MSFHFFFFFCGVVMSLYSLDLMILYFFNHLIHTPLLDSIMICISYGGLLYFGLFVALLLYLFGGLKGKRVSKILVCSLLVSFFVIEIIKLGVMRPRPYDVLSSLVVIGHEWDYSFPSGHTVNMTVLSYILGKSYGHLDLFLICPLIIGITRLYLGMHYPSDVLGAYIIGLLLAFICFNIFSRRFKINNI